MVEPTPSKKPLLNADIEYSNPMPRLPKTEALQAPLYWTMRGGLSKRKKGHMFFFVCCDTRRAVLCLNTTMLLLNMSTLTAAVMQLDCVKAEGYMKVMIVRGCGMFVPFTTLPRAFWYSKSIVIVGLTHTCY